MCFLTEELGVIEMFSYAVMDEACCGTNVLLIAV